MDSVLNQSNSNYLKKIVERNKEKKALEEKYKPKRIITLTELRGDKFRKSEDEKKLRKELKSQHDKLLFAEFGTKRPIGNKRVAVTLVRDSTSNSNLST